ncbi:hypothetical protein EVAR_13137_1 [Eumeta japonica]|uniref:Uncharacterized protein n=1 Tax=Eumeta variegata TaxID=151549 RepID=A0A4C1UAM6_EUMVA|nr:hypothetical protein EVAR_13137_1 [Eumeta japonica]
MSRSPNFMKLAQTERPPARIQNDGKRAVIGQAVRKRSACFFFLVSPVASADSGGARRRRRRRPPTASRLKGPRKQKSFAYKLLKRSLAKSFAYKLLKRGLANLMSPTSTSGVAPPLSADVW